MIPERSTYTYYHGNLSTARFLWQLGEWETLATLEIGEHGEAKSDQEYEILTYKMQAKFMTGAVDDGHALLQKLVESGVSRTVLGHILLSGASASLARAHILANDPKSAERNTRAALTFYLEPNEVDLIIRTRKNNEMQASKDNDLATADKLSEKTLFIDCGGYDGCSAISFLLANPNANIISFEPNPDLWHYYDEIPTKLVRKAAYTYDGHISFTVDPVDGDGSTIMEGKKIDFKGSVKNEDCPVLNVPCVDISSFVRQSASEFDRVILKLDVEGAEYDILEKMLKDNTIELVEHIYCEFHQNKINIDPERHKNVVHAVSEKLPLSDWDSLPFSANIPDSKGLRTQRRAMLLNAIQSNRTRVEHQSCDR